MDLIKIRILIYLENTLYQIYIYTLCVGVCLFVFNKRQNGWTDRAKIMFSGTWSREGLWMGRLKLTHLWPFSKSKFNLKSDRVKLVSPASPIECLLYLPNVRAIQYKLGPERSSVALMLCPSIWKEKYPITY